MNGDLTILGLVLRADPVVKGVMLLLVAASVAVWAIVFLKTAQILRARREMQAVEALARDSAGAAAVPGPGLAQHLLAAGNRARGDGESGESRTEARGRIERALRQRLLDELRAIEHGLPVLATVGSAAPFVGLFGTVWGIMNSFTAIAASHDTSLAVVAPGIAEALFATAIGLAAAIPAVVAYNALVAALGRLGHRAGAAAGALGARLARADAALLAAAD